jgi:hypothetical protein
MANARARPSRKGRLWIATLRDGESSEKKRFYLWFTGREQLLGKKIISGGECNFSLEGIVPPPSRRVVV